MTALSALQNAAARTAARTAHLLHPALDMAFFPFPGCRLIAF
jgi:hypothetical protein